MYTVHVRKPGQTVLFEGNLEQCQVLAKVLEAFPQDVMKLEIVDENANTLHRWLSPYWND